MTLGALTRPAPPWMGATALYEVYRATGVGLPELVDRAANTGASSHGAFAGNVERRVERLGWER